MSEIKYAIRHIKLKYIQLAKHNIQFTFCYIILLG